MVSSEFLLHLDNLWHQVGDLDGLRTMAHAGTALYAIGGMAFGDDGGQVALDAPGAVDLELVEDGDELRDVALLEDAVFLDGGTVAPVVVVDLQLGEIPGMMIGKGAQGLDAGMAREDRRSKR